MTKENQITDLLNAIEFELRALQLWQEAPSNDEALNSQEPFAVDTLAPHQWLQWIFIARMRVLLETKQSLPTDFSMAAYFEQSWIGDETKSRLIALIQQMDEVFDHA